MAKQQRQYTSVKFGKVIEIETNPYLASTDKVKITPVSISTEENAHAILEHQKKFKNNSSKTPQNPHCFSAFLKVHMLNGGRGGGFTLNQEVLTPALNSLHKYLQDSLVTTYGNSSVINRYLNKYLTDIILRDLSITYTSKIPHRHYSGNTTIKVLHKQALTKSWKQIVLNGKRLWASSLLLPLLVSEIIKGNNAQRISSGVTFDNRLVIDAIEEYIWCNPKSKASKISDRVFTSIIDAKALEEYNNGLVRGIDSDIKKLEVTSILSNTSRAGVLTQPIMKQSACPGFYLGGVNLQTASKEVRHVALAGNYAYDLQASVFAMYAGRAVDQADWPAMRNYIINRTAIRNKVAFDTRLSVDQVKEAITTIGFGARFRKGGPIEHLLGAPGMVLFAAHPEIKKLLIEFRKASNLVKRKGIIPNKDYIFHHLQLWVMNEFIRCSGQKPNLIVHDCVYFQKPIDLQTTIDSMELDYFDKSYLKFEETKISAHRRESKGSTGDIL